VTRERDHGRSITRLLADALEARRDAAEPVAAAIDRVAAALRQHRRDGRRTSRMVLSDADAAALASAARGWVAQSFTIPAMLAPSGYERPVPYGELRDTIAAATGSNTTRAATVLRTTCDRLGILPTFARPKGHPYQLTITAGERRAVLLQLKFDPAQED
jgi:hypothetical protein